MYNIHVRVDLLSYFLGVICFLIPYLRTLLIRCSLIVGDVMGNGFPDKLSCVFNYIIHDYHIEL